MVTERQKTYITLGVGLLAISLMMGWVTTDQIAEQTIGRLQTGPTGEGPVGTGNAQNWRITTKDALGGSDLTVDTVDTLVNGVHIGDPSLNSGYVEYTAHPVHSGDVIQFQMVESGYYTIVTSFTVPTLAGLQGGQTFYTLNSAVMYQDATTDPTFSATYGGTDIDASTWDISASTEYSGVKATLDISLSAMNDLAFGGKPFQEIVGDKDRMGKFIHFDANDSDVIIKDVKLEGTPLTLIWSDSTDSSDFQSIYEFDQMLTNDADVSGDGLYDFTFTLVFSSDQTQLILIAVRDLEDYENIQMGAPTKSSGEAGYEEVSITTS